MPKQYTLREYRKYLGLTQDELAERLETAKARISEYETGVRTPSVPTLIEYAEKLRVQVVLKPGHKGFWFTEDEPLKEMTDDEYAEYIDSIPDL
jgi:transcriptional regulator with XRE-family HTH domain